MSRYVTVDRGGAPGQLRQHHADPRRWLLRLFLGRDRRGKRQYVSEVFYGGKRQAEARLSELAQQKYSGRLTPRTPATLTDLVSEWLTEKTKEVSARTLRGYRLYLETYVLPTLGHLKIGDITLRDVDRLYSDMLAGTLPAPEEGEGGWRGAPLSARTVRLTHATLSQVFTQAVRWQMIPFNPISEATLPKESRRAKRALTVAERTRFIAASQEAFYRVLYRLLMDTGMRPGEALALTWEDIDFASERISITKTITKGAGGKAIIAPPKTRRSTRTIPLFGLADLLLEHQRWQIEMNLDASGMLFTTQEGTPLTPWNHNRRDLRRALDAAGITGTFTLYNFRHTFASLHLESGTPLKVVSEWLGHSTIKQTADTYSHLHIDVSEDWARRHVAYLDRASKEREEALAN